MKMLVGMMLNRWVTNSTLLMRSLLIENVHVPFMNTSLVKGDVEKCVTRFGLHKYEMYF